MSKQEQQPFDFEKVMLSLATELAQAQIVNMRMRCAQGVGAHDQEMPPYSPMSRKTGPRDLHQTGSMLRSLHVSSTSKTSGGYEATIGFSLRNDAIKAAHNQERSPWFGFSPDDEKHIGAIAEGQFRDLMQEALNAERK